MRVVGWVGAMGGGVINGPFYNPTCLACLLAYGGRGTPHPQSSKLPAIPPRRRPQLWVRARAGGHVYACMGSFVDDLNMFLS